MLCISFHVSTGEWTWYLCNLMWVGHSDICWCSVQSHSLPVTPHSRAPSWDTMYNTSVLPYIATPTYLSAVGFRRSALTYIHTGSGSSTACGPCGSSDVYR